MNDLTILHGPALPADLNSDLVYQVTLPNGAVLTRPSDLADAYTSPVPPIFSEAGNVLEPSGAPAAP